MAENRGKPPAKPPDEDSFTNTGSGRVGRDDRGNMTWEWADDGEFEGDDTLGTAERIRALVDPKLKIEDDAPGGNQPAQSNPKGLKKGYDPYDSGALGKAQWKKKRNLRELSKWIELRRKVQEKDEADGGEGNDEDT